VSDPHVRRTGAFVAALIGGYLMSVALDPQSGAGTAVWTFLAGLALWVAVAAVLVRFYAPGVETFSADEVGVAPEWRAARFLRLGQDAAPLYLAPVPGAAPVPGPRAAPRRVGQADRPGPVADRRGPAGLLAAGGGRPGAGEPAGSQLSELSGRLLDQAALLGVLVALYDPGLPPVSVACRAARGPADTEAPLPLGAPRGRARSQSEVLP
jgi:hypothetical protein